MGNKYSGLQIGTQFMRGLHRECVAHDRRLSCKFYA